MMVRMDITPYADQITAALATATRGLPDSQQQVVAQLSGAVDPAARLAIMEAVSQASAEISEAMPGGRVDVRLVGRDLAFDVTAIQPPQPAPPAPDEDDNQARFTLRLPESLKTQAEQCAAEQGQSLNTWLIGAVRAATHSAGLSITIDPFGLATKVRPGRRMSGWV